MIELGQEVKDRVTGFKGIAIGRTVWLNGCARITVQAKMDKEGKLSDPVCIDEPQLEVVGKGSYSGGSKKTGGPIPAPTRQPNPKR